ncbi:hypothetical protein [Pseudoxanthomonas yeongjuensis]|uniref:hypothetical protein n=1 Tax=Pseudoxanthomonas yeongjuensis TaxID=377616 RepID=UPI00139080D3|nr:hypothetical protein [Pseudoxanthomonas yeongjuensis]
MGAAHADSTSSGPSSGSAVSAGLPDSAADNPRKAIAAMMRTEKLDVGIAHRVAM